MKRIFYPLALAALLGFWGMLVYYRQEPVRQLDERAAALFGGIGWLDAMSVVADQWPIFLVSFFLLVFLWGFRKNYRGMLFVFFTVGAGNVLNQLLKEWIQRPRPDFPQELESYTFPSNHAMLGLLYLFTLAYFLGEGIASKSVRLMIWGIAVVLSLLVALSRVAGREQYFSDVVAGLCLGYMLFVVVAVWYEMREGQFKKRRENAEQLR